MENNRLFRNNGDGAFTRVEDSGLEGGAKGYTTCAMGDINNNGLLDVFVGNSFDWYHRGAIHSDLYTYNVPLGPMSVQWGSVFDSVAHYLPTFMPIGPMEWEWSGHDVEEGFLDVLLNTQVQVAAPGPEHHSDGRQEAGRVTS